MDQLILLIVGVVTLGIGAVLGYYARQSIAKKQIGTIEAKIQQKISQCKEEAELIFNEAKQKANQILESAKREETRLRQRIFKTEQLLLRRENILDSKLFNLEKREKELFEKAQKVKTLKEALESLRQEALGNLERISGLSKEAAKVELLANLEKDYEREISEKLRRVEAEGLERYEKRAKEMIALAIQKFALSQAQELTTTTVALPSDEIKGRIIGKEGRNIRALEKLTGVEIVVDDTPEAVVISGFDPVRRQIAKVALERLIRDGPSFYFFDFVKSLFSKTGEI